METDLSEICREKGLMLPLKKKSIAGYEIEHDQIRMKGDKINVDDGRYGIPVFLRERSN